MTNETAFNQALLLDLCSIEGVRLFRNNVGVGWVGKPIRHAPYEITLANPRPLHAGLIKGSGDDIGWTSIEITPDMVGKRVAIFTSIEAKSSTGQLREAQKIWHDNVLAAGGISGQARTIEEGRKIIFNKLLGYK